MDPTSPEYMALTFWQVAIASLLIVFNAGISLAFRLGLERTLLWAGVRVVAQLTLVGLVLGEIFARPYLAVVLTMASLMTLFAGVSAVRRTSRRYPGVWLNAIGSVGVSAWLVAAYALLLVFQRGANWYEPHFSLPIFGMILGNTVSGVALGLNRIEDELATKRDQVEMLLSLGATRWEAASPSLRLAVRDGMIPTLNSMLIVGVVSLPGILTGQLVSGVDPAQAVKYQIVIMFLLASGTSLGTVSVVLLTYFRLFNARHQFLWQQLTLNN